MAQAMSEGLFLKNVNFLEIQSLSRFQRQLPLHKQYCQLNVYSIATKFASRAKCAFGTLNYFVAKLPYGSYKRILFSYFAEII